MEINFGTFLQISGRRLDHNWDSKNIGNGDLVFLHTLFAYVHLYPTSPFIILEPQNHPNDDNYVTK